MICLKKINLEKTPFNQAYNQISNGYIQVNTINGDSLLFGNGYELIEIIGDKDLLELILNRHSKENTCDEEILDTTDLNNELELNCLTFKEQKMKLIIF